jgi:hypothetical protein
MMEDNLRKRYRMPDRGVTMGLSWVNPTCRHEVAQSTQVTRGGRYALRGEHPVAGETTSTDNRLNLRREDG